MKWAGGGVAGNELHDLSEARYLFIYYYFMMTIAWWADIISLYGVYWFLLLPNFLCLSRVFGGVYRTIKVSGTAVKL